MLVNWRRAFSYSAWAFSGVTDLTRFLIRSICAGVGSFDCMWIPFIKRFNQSLDSSILDLEAMQVLGEPHLESQDFEHQVRLLQQGLPLLGEFRLDQCL